MVPNVTTYFGAPFAQTCISLQFQLVPVRHEFSFNLDTEVYEG